LAESGSEAADAIVVPLGSGAERGRPREPARVESSQLRAPAAEETPAPPRSNGQGGHHALASEDAVTVTVPLRITVRAGNGSGRRPAVGVDLS
jgi:hypothetical protein